MMQIGNDWDDILSGEFTKEYYIKLREFVAGEYENYRIYPPEADIFNALSSCSYEDTKVVIFGQDPYHQEGQAHGLCFSVNRGVKIPPSLLNIYKELKEDIGMEIPSHGCLSSWALQGVLLLNTVLTVRDSMPNSHKGRGWETFTDVIIHRLNEREKPIVFILWGANAKTKEKLITAKHHLILTGTHPSPLSAHTGFFGGAYFSRANRFLELENQEPINWASVSDN